MRRPEEERGQDEMEMREVEREWSVREVRSEGAWSCQEPWRCECQGDKAGKPERVWDSE